MRKIDRQKEPDFWIEYKKIHPKERYEDLEKLGGKNEQNERKVTQRRTLSSDG